MEFTIDKKKSVEKMMVDSMIDAVGAGIISEEELAVVSDFILNRIDAIKTEEELVTFLIELSQKWSFFLPIERFIEGEAKEAEDKKSVDKAENLIKNGQIDQALQVLKAAEGVS
jgi:hypothetical protein